jgi:hypothetical protein
MGRVPDKTVPRPSQVTIAGWLVIVGSVFVVLSSFDQIAGLRTLETREAVEEFLEGGGKGLGLDVQGTLSLMRVLTMVAAACATAAAILGWQVLQRSRSARLVLTGLAVPLFLTGLTVGGFFAAVVTGAITMLWFQPARDWVDGKTPRPAPERPAAPRVAAPTAPPPAPVAPPADGPREVSGFGDRAGLLASLPPPTAAPWGTAPSAAPGRPPALVWACVLTWVGAGLTALVMVATVALVLADPDLLVDELYRQNPSFESEGLSVADIRTTTVVVGVLLVVWSLAAVVLAAYAWSRRSWAWTGLLVSASTAALLCLLGAFGGPVLLLPMAWCAAATVLLLRRDVRAFIRG